MLDPSCGSGTFLAAAARHLIAHAGDLPPGEQLAKLQENIAGIDLHPVAVQLAKATWVITCREVIMAARDSGPAGGTITAPVHLGDSLQLRYDNSELDAQGYITLDTREKLDGQNDYVRFQVPLSLARDTERFENLMLDLSDAIERGDDANQVLDKHAVTSPAEREPMAAAIANMEALHNDNRNHVWAYYLRNMTRPTVIAEGKVDAIIGNPPWLSYNESAGIIRNELEIAEPEPLPDMGWRTQLAPKQEVATLFYCRVVELYLRENRQDREWCCPTACCAPGIISSFADGYYESKSAHPAPGLPSRP